MADLLIYGATGYTGRMIARRAAAHGLNFSVGGRYAGKVSALAAEVGAEELVLDINDQPALEAAVKRATCVINAAGPFAATARQMMAACVGQTAHYIDITGEVDVFTLAQSLDDDARNASVMLMPGAGWDVVPSDCIALHVTRRLPGAERLRIGLAHINGMPSRGTLRTGLSMAGRMVMRRNGELVELAAPLPPVEMDFGFSNFQCAQMPMGDVVTAFKSTGIGNIEVYGAGAGKMVEPTGGIESFPDGPTEEQNAKWRAFAMAEALTPDGTVARSVIETGSGYEFTAAAAVDIAERILAGRFTAGFQSPASAYGVSLATDLGGKITDL